MDWRNIDAVVEVAEAPVVVRQSRETQIQSR